MTAKYIVRSALLSRSLLSLRRLIRPSHLYCHFRVLPILSTRVDLLSADIPFVLPTPLSLPFGSLPFVAQPPFTSGLICTYYLLHTARMFSFSSSLL